MCANKIVQKNRDVTIAFLFLILYILGPGLTRYGELIMAAKAKKATKKKATKKKAAKKK